MFPAWKICNTVVQRAFSRQERIREEREREAKNQKTSFAYRHPFAADKKGLGNLVGGGSVLSWTLLTVVGR